MLSSTWIRLSCSICFVLISLHVGCLDGEEASKEEESSEPEIQTFQEQIDVYGYGIDVVDAYFLEESSVGTRLVVTIDIKNESEPAKVTFTGNANAHRPTPYVVTNGAGNLSSVQFGPMNLFQDEFETAHTWCNLPLEIDQGGSARCSIFFYEEGKRFDAVERMILKVTIEGASQPTTLVNAFEMPPRML